MDIETKMVSNTRYPDKNIESLNLIYDYFSQVELDNLVKSVTFQLFDSRTQLRFILSDINNIPKIEFNSVSVVVELTYPCVRYRQYLYDLSLSVKDQVGINFSESPSIPYYFENVFSVGFIISNVEKYVTSIPNEIYNKYLEYLNAIENGSRGENGIDGYVFNNPFENAMLFTVNREIEAERLDSQSLFIPNRPTKWSRIKTFINGLYNSN